MPVRYQVPILRFIQYGLQEYSFVSHLSIAAINRWKWEEPVLISIDLKLITSEISLQKKSFRRYTNFSGDHLAKEGMQDLKRH